MKSLGNICAVSLHKRFVIAHFPSEQRMPEALIASEAAMGTASSDGGNLKEQPQDVYAGLCGDFISSALLK